MYIHSYFKLLILIIFCTTVGAQAKQTDKETNQDLIILETMIQEREKAMIDKNVDKAMSQFSEDITWINSQGYFFKGKKNVLDFHNMLVNNKSQDYFYEAGTPRIRLTSSDTALVYYSWKMFWYEKGRPEKISNEEIGLMTLSAEKHDGKWYWIAVTNQHTPWFYESIDEVTMN